jgi:transposase InsO family protein
VHSHPNALLTQKSRFRLINHHLQDRRPLAQLAAEAGISLRCAYKRLARFRSGGAASLADRRSVRRTQSLTLDPQHEQHAVELRHLLLRLRHIVRLLAAPFSTVARLLNRLGLGRLRNLDPKPPEQRYERDHLGALIHIDVKKLARFRKLGHRITGNRQQGRSAGVVYDRVHVAINDATRLAYVEVLADEQQATPIGFLCRAVAWFNSQGVECRQVMSDNGPVYFSRSFAKACKVQDLMHIRTRPYTPRTNGNAERFIQTLCREWAYGMPFQNSEERNRRPPRYPGLIQSLSTGWAAAVAVPASAVP